MFDCKDRSTLSSLHSAPVLGLPCTGGQGHRMGTLRIAGSSEKRWKGQERNIFSTLIRLILPLAYCFYASKRGRLCRDPVKVQWDEGHELS